LVGRFFMEHPHARGAEILDADLLTLLRLGKSFRFKGSRFAAAMRPAPALQRQAEILNTSFNINVRQRPDEDLQPAMKLFNLMRHKLAAPNQFWRKTWLAIKHSGVWVQEQIDPWRPYALYKMGLRGAYVVVRTEQSPNPDSRVMVSAHERDALGLPQVQLNWQLSALDKKSIKVTMESFDAELRRLNLGRLALSPWLDDPAQAWKFDMLISKNPIAGYHHMGTTRMSDTPQTGVVDANAKVHGIDNLYVAGSSVFPTSGWANPTLTILALAMKLGDHLKRA
jgi:choline dehydrogenase-like flavoprotein